MAQEIVAAVKGEGVKPGAVQVNVGQDGVVDAGVAGEQIVPPVQENSTLVGGQREASDEAKDGQQITPQCKVLLGRMSVDEPNAMRYNMSRFPCLFVNEDAYALDQRQQQDASTGRT